MVNLGMDESSAQKKLIGDGIMTIGRLDHRKSYQKVTDNQTVFFSIVGYRTLFSSSALGIDVSVPFGHDAVTGAAF